MWQGNIITPIWKVRKPRQKSYLKKFPRMEGAEGEIWTSEIWTQIQLWFNIFFSFGVYGVHLGIKEERKGGRVERGLEKKDKVKRRPEE